MGRNDSFCGCLPHRIEPYVDLEKRGKAVLESVKGLVCAKRFLKGGCISAWKPTQPQVRPGGLCSTARNGHTRAQDFSATLLFETQVASFPQTILVSVAFTYLA